ncbi:MAG TPA: hypothetical protein VF487_12760 [Chitinophagaceae bacterium]
MKHILLSFFIGSVLFFSACRKERNELPPPVPEEACSTPTDNPSNRSYIPDSLTLVSNVKKNCGFLPLSRNSYWIYKDSVFSDGSLLRVQYDTLRFTKTYQSKPDKLTWWETNIEIGLPDLLFANDSSIFAAEYRFMPDPVREVKKDFGLFSGDSIQYLTSFDDNAAMGKSVKLQASIPTPAGSFTDCILIEKKAPFYRMDKIYFKPGLGVVKYISEVAPAGSPFMELKQISTLVSYRLD